MEEDYLIILALIGIGFILLRRSNPSPGSFAPNAPGMLDQYGGDVIPYTISSQGLQFIEHQEGFSATPYVDSDGKERWGFGTPASGSHISELDASNELNNFLAQNVEPIINSSVTVPINQNQYDALCSFVFNVGAGAFKQSTLLKNLNSGNYNGAAQQFSQWINSNGQPSAALQARRQAEQQLFTSGA